MRQQRLETIRDERISTQRFLGISAFERNQATQTGGELLGIMRVKWRCMDAQYITEDMHIAGTAFERIQAIGMMGAGEKYPLTSSGLGRLMREAVVRAAFERNQAMDCRRVYRRRHAPVIQHRGD